MGCYTCSNILQLSLRILQARLDELEKELLEINANSERLQRSYSELLELQLVLEKAGSFFDDAQHRASAAQFERAPAAAADCKCMYQCDLFHTLSAATTAMKTASDSRLQVILLASALASEHSTLFLAHEVLLQLSK